jgi:hypothetical protein
VRRPSNKVLDALSEGLDEMDSSFGFSAAVPDKTEERTPEDAVEDDDDLDTDELNDGYVDREEIEVAMDSFLSALISAGVIRKQKSGKSPLFSDLFAKFFGVDHEVTTKARRFEEHVKGYFGWINPEDMDLARDEFSEIYELVEKARNRNDEGE